MSYDQTAADLMAENKVLRAELEALRVDAERYRWLSARMLAADFDYGGAEVLIFEMPKGFLASANCNSTVDAAMAAREPT